MTSRGSAIGTAQQAVLLANAACEMLAGMAFLALPGHAIPQLTINGRVTARVLGAALLALAVMAQAAWGVAGGLGEFGAEARQVALAMVRCVAFAHALWHAAAFVVLGYDAFVLRRGRRAAEPSPFAPVATLHAVLFGASAFLIATLPDPLA